MLLDTKSWADEPLILISHRPLVEKLKLDPKTKIFSFNTVAPSEELKAIIREAHELRRAEKTLSREQIEAENVGMRLTLFTRIADGSAFLLVPPPAPATELEPWLTPPAAQPTYPGETYEKAVQNLQGMARSYLARDSFQLNLQANQLRGQLRSLNPDLYPSDFRLNIEVFYNRSDFFELSTLIYGLALLLLVIQHIKPLSPWLNYSAYALAILGFLLNIAAITLRCIIAQRPPVTNMYESVIWVAFGVIAFGLIFLWKYKSSFYLLAALPAAIFSLLLVHQLPIAMPPRLDPLVPVLRSNFWLTIHVLTITLSYSAFLLAWAFAHIILFRVIRNPKDSAREDHGLHFWLYRVLQIGILLLAVGTILGGVWANYSWGRFWGWDPKETWALIALLSYIFALHGRLAGWWGKFGLAVASIVCFMSVIMAWYGVNFVLGVGLHSYGFGLGGEEYVIGFLLLDAAFLAIAIWRSRQTKTALEPAT
ncbi:MAG: cytochrome c biogenesis protein CcsA [Blastochloris sp.]|nr:cytochrome c biogenesis protein CcsA [Blastochloris sp.]